MFQAPIAQAGCVLMVLVTTYVVVVGGRLERAAALLVALNWVLVNAFSIRHAGHRMPWADFAIDSVFALIFTAVAIITRRTWAAYLAAFQVLGVANYVSYLLDRGVLNRAFVTTSYLWAAAALASLVAAGISAQRGRRPSR